MEEILYYYAFQIVVSLIISYILIIVASFLMRKLQDTSIRILNPTEYFPEEEVKTLKQVYYLVLIFIILFIITNFFFDNGILMANNPDLYELHAVLDILVSVYLATFIYNDKSRNRKLLLFLLPIASIAYLIFGPSYVEVSDLFRIPGLLYLVKLLYGKFRAFTDEHALGFSIMLLFSIIFFSVIFTIIIENEDPLDAVIMVSNAFTSNGYAILGDTPGGKFNSLILVWSGYIISGAATATLTAAILLRHRDHHLEDYEKKLDEIQSTLDELKEKLEKEE